MRAVHRPPPPDTAPRSKTKKQSRLKTATYQAAARSPPAVNLADTVAAAGADSQADEAPAETQTNAVGSQGQGKAG